MSPLKPSGRPAFRRRLASGVNIVTHRGAAGGRVVPVLPAVRAVIGNHPLVFHSGVCTWDPRHGALVKSQHK